MPLTSYWARSKSPTTMGDKRRFDDSNSQSGYRRGESHHRARTPLKIQGFDRACSPQKQGIDRAHSPLKTQGMDAGHSHGGKSRLKSDERDPASSERRRLDKAGTDGGDRSGNSAEEERKVDDVDDYLVLMVKLKKWCV